MTSGAMFFGKIISYFTTGDPERPCPQYYGGYSMLKGKETSDYIAHKGKQNLEFSECL